MTIDRFEHCSSGSPAASKVGYFTTNMLATPEILPLDIIIIKEQGKGQRRKELPLSRQPTSSVLCDCLFKTNRTRSPSKINDDSDFLFTCWCARCWGHGLRVVDQSLVLGNAVRGGGNGAVPLLHVVGRSPGKVVTADLGICVSEGVLDVRREKGAHTST